MVDFAGLFLFVLALGLTAASPGPAIAALVARVLAKGWRDALPFVTGMWVGELIWLTCVVLGLAVIAEQFQFLFQIVKYAGVIYLLWLAWNMWNAPLVETGEHDNSGNRQRVRMFFAGLSVAIGNPKIMVFYIALLPSLIDLTTINVAGWLELLVVTLAVLSGIDILYMALATRTRALLKSPVGLKFANRVGAFFLGAAAGFIVLRS